MHALTSLRRRATAPAVVTLLFALTYALAVVAGRATRPEPGALALLWPASGVALLWLLHVRSRRCLALATALLLVLTGLLNQATGLPALAAWNIAAATTVQAHVVLRVLRRLAPRGLRLQRARALWVLLLAAVAGSAVGAVLAAPGNAVLLDRDPAHLALQWFARHVSGTTIVAGIALALDRRRGGGPSAARWFEYVAVMTTATAGFHVLFNVLHKETLTFVVVPVAVWLGMRTSVRVTAWTMTGVSCFHLLMARAGAGPFGGLPLVERAVAVQLFLLVVTVLALVLALHHDERRQLVAGLRRASGVAEEQMLLLSTVFDRARDALTVCAADGTVLMHNSAAQDLLGDVPADVRAAVWTRFTSLERPDGTPYGREDRPLVRALAGEHVDHVDVHGTLPDGGRVVLDVTVHPLPPAPGAAWSRGALMSARDVTAERAAHRAVRESRDLFAGVLDAATEVAIVVCDVDGRIVLFNGGAHRLLGYTAEEVLGRTPLLWYDTGEVEARADELGVEPGFDVFTAVPRREGSETRQWTHVTKDSRRLQVSLSVSLLRDGAGEVIGAIGVATDVTARLQAEAALVHRAHHDALTGLPNRVLLHERLTTALRAAREGTSVGLVAIDLDGFKHVNDSAGHAAGDDLLQAVADRLSLCVRGDDTVARLGGDEFAVLCPAASRDDLRGVAQRVLAALQAPFTLDAGTFHVGASIGWSVAGADGPAVEELLQQADEAMYAAKRDGKNRAYGYDVRDRARAERAAVLLPQLADALRRGEFRLHGQPVVDLGSGAVVAVETLLRWQHPERGLLTPGEFLDVLESSPFMPAVGRHVLHESCRMAAGWSAALGADAPAVHVNVSARQLEAGTFLSEVRGALDRFGLDPHLLVVELTETHAAHITESLRGDLEDLRRLGVRVAIDDLGTGYSGLARLTELPVDVLKIDLQFVRGMLTDPSCDAVVRAVLSIGQALGTTVVAEGVETAEQADRLRSYGADTGQGWLFGRPVPEPDLLAALTAQPAPTA
ncbi:bifunctional diguanylate cyclase/phosphodiesterase [Kineococcus terrestris]|uniref:bifunctional diguanylate cyclase/phosphodiesterase n=1 Tax=Kineococcus terrestris TaxID=2044856 RepID=UPI0034DB1D58